MNVIVKRFEYYICPMNLKFYFQVLSLSAAMLSVAQAEVFLTRDNSASEVNWSSATWRHGSHDKPVVTDLIPGYKNEELGIDTTDASVQFPGGSNNAKLQLNIDDNYTIGKFISEYGQFSVNMNMTGMLDEGASDSSITIKATDPAASTYTFMEFGTSMRIKVEPAEIKFTGGTVNLVGLNEGSNARITIRNGGNGQDGGINGVTPSVLTFSETNVLNVESALYIQGTNNSSILPENLDATINLNGTLNVRKNTGTAESPEYTYYKLTIASCSSSVGIGLKANMTGTTNALSFQQDANTQVNLTGLLNITGSNETTNDTGAVFILSKGAEFNVLDGGRVEMATQSQTSYADVYMYAGSTLNIEDGGVFSAGGRFGSAYSSSGNSVINIKQGGTLSVPYFRVSAGTIVNLYGKYISEGNHMTYIAGGTSEAAKSYLNVYAGATGDAWVYQVVYNGEINIYEGVAEGALRTRSNVIILDNNGATINFYSSNPFKGSAESSTQKDILVQNSVGDGYLNIYANQDFRCLDYSVKAVTDTIDKITTTIFIGDDVTRINFNTLANNKLVAQAEGNMEHWLIIDNFRLELIHVDNRDSQIDFSYIKSLDGDWVDFCFVEDTNGGYWLSATQVLIPEPSLVAAFFALAALGFVCFKKRK